MKNTLSSFELSHMVAALQGLIGAKVDKIFQSDKQDNFLLSVHVPGQGKQHIFIALPGVCCLTSFKPPFPTTPPAFCSALRRKISGARIRKIYQRGFERMMAIEVEGKNGVSTLWLELFAPGNIILVDDAQRILSVFQPKVYSQERKVLPQHKYVFPPAQQDPQAFSQEQFKDMLACSDKESIVKSLAIECSFGGLYAEEILVRAGLDKHLQPQQLGDQQIKNLYETLQTFLTLPSNSSRREGECFPIVLQSQKVIESDRSFSEEVAALVLKDIEKEERRQQNKQRDKQQSKYDVILKKQRSQLKGLQKSSLENQRKGELIYEQYGVLEKLFAKIAQDRKELSWDELVKKYEEHGIRISPKEKTVTVNLS